MWPFNKTLSGKYSKLVKLIKNIDPHFQITEDTQDSIRLHLPNYKGNQEMDFHIYLMEPYLFISFMTEIEGEKISCINNFQQNTDQLDMFNFAMANNLAKVHEVMRNKYSEENNDNIEENTNINVQYTRQETMNSINSPWDDIDDKEPTSIEANNCLKGAENVVNSFNGVCFNYDESSKKHALTIMALRSGTEFLYFAENEANPLWMYNGNLFCDQDDSMIGASAFVWFMQHYNRQEDFCYLLDFLGVGCMGKEYLDLWTSSLLKEPNEMITDIKQYIPSFKLGNDLYKVKSAIHQTWMDIKVIYNFIDYCSNILSTYEHMSSDHVVNTIQDCKSLKDTALLFLSDFHIINKKTEDIEQKDTEDKQEQKLRDDCENNSNEATVKTKIVKSWPLLEFAKSHGKMQVGEFNNDETGEIFHTCIFTKPDGTRTFVAFDSELGELTPAEIVAMKNELVVGQLHSGNYCLCKKEYALELFIQINKEKSIKEEIICDINKTWSLTEFNKANGQHGYFEQFINNKTNDTYKAYVLNKNDNLLYVVISPTIVELEVPELLNLVHSLFVIKYNSGIYVLSQNPKEKNLISRDNVFVNASIASATEDDYVDSITDKYGVVFSVDKKRLLKAPKALKEYNTPEGTEVICNNAFSKCEIQKIVINEGVKIIGNSAFESCVNLRTVTMSDSVMHIEKSAFSHCKTLKNISLSRNLEEIKPDTFWYCSELTDIIIPEKVKVIGSRAFYGSINLNSIVIPHNVNIIGSEAFYGCDRLSSVEIQDGVKTIGKEAFSWCHNLYTIKLADSIEEIGSGAFFLGNRTPSFSIHVGQKEKFVHLLPSYEGCFIEEEYKEDLETIVTQEDIKNAWADEQGVLYSNNGKRLLRGNKELSNYAIRVGTVTICDGAFENATLLKNIDFPDTIINIGKKAFHNCSSLNNFTLPTSSRILDYAFEGCTSIGKVSILSFGEVGKEIFKDCINLKTIYIPSKCSDSLGEYCDLVDRTEEYPFVHTWSLDDFISLHGVMTLEERVDEETGDYHKCLIFKKSYAETCVLDDYYWGGENTIENIQGNPHFRIGMDSGGYFWYYDKTLPFWLPGMGC